MTSAVRPLLEASSITKSFAGVHALRNASFELRPHEVHALIGENGAGKSTLIKVLTGAHQPDGGVLAVAGERIVHLNPAHARTLGIAVIYQQPSLFPHLSVAENIALALESQGLWRTVNWRERNKRAADLLEKAGSGITPDRLVSTLSMPEQQIVEIAKAIGAKARIVIMDEPTASLTDREVVRLFDVIRNLRASGAGVIYISHRLEEIAAIADRVTVMRDGETIGTQDVASVSREQMIRMMVGREIAAVFPKREVRIGETLLELRDLSSQSAGVRNVSFSLRRGEIFGIAGLVGSGRTELARVLFGLEPYESGSIALNGNSISPRTPAEAIATGIAYVPEDRRQHGVILPMSVSENVSLAGLKAVSSNGMLEADREYALASTFVEKFRIKTSSLHTQTAMLSGGNQQKVALARWLATDPQVIILDEPTQGVDVGSKSEIHSLMVDLAEQGRGIIMISSELPEVLGMSDRIAVMHEGTIAGILLRDQASPQQIMTLALGHTPGEYSGPVQ